MGEFLSCGGVQKALKDIPSITVQGYRLTKNLAESLSNVHININSTNDVEHDIVRGVFKSKKQ